MRSRFTIPTPGSPAYVLVIASIFFALLGILFATGGLFAIRADGVQADNLMILATGVLLGAIAIPTGISGFKRSETPQSLLSSDMNPFERISHTKDPAEIELANKEIAEVSGIAIHLAPSDHRLLEIIRTTTLSAPSHDDVVRTFATKTSTGIQLANPALQPIAFALRPVTGWNYVKGVLLETLTWALVILATPLILVSDVWADGRRILHRALRFSRLARQYRGRSQKLLRYDERMPVLYLRSFSDDYRESSETFLPTTSEEKLVRSYSRVGPVIAFGNPGERLPIPGASRLYLNDDSIWQPAILFLMSVSQLLIVQAGNGLGLLQELSFARWRSDPSKFIISFNGWEDLDEWTRHLHYLRFKKFAEALLECKLPEDIKATSHLTFDAGWEPRPQSNLSYSLPSVRKRRAKLKRVAVGVLTIAGACWSVLIAPSVLMKITDMTAVNRRRESVAQWKDYALGSTGLVVELPGEPRTLIGRGLEVSAFTYDSEDLVSIMHYERYSSDAKLDETALRTQAAALCGVDAVIDFVKQQRGFGKSWWEGKCSQDGKQHTISGYCFLKGQELWMVLARYDSSKNEASATGERILNSVKIAGFDTYKGNATWKLHPLGSTGMTVELPDEPTKVNQTDVVGPQDYSAYVYNAGNLIALMQYARFYFYESINKRVLRKVAANVCGADATSDLTPHQIGAGKLELDGKCSRNGEEYKLRGYCLTEGENFWLILTLYDPSDKAAVLAVDKMLNSVKIGKQKLAP